MCSIINIFLVILKIILILVSLFMYKNIYDFFKSLYENRHEGISKDEIIMSVMLLITSICAAIAVFLVMIK